MSMEERIARFESDMGHVKKDVAQIADNVRGLQAGLIAANDANASIKMELVKTTGELRAGIGRLRSELKEEISSVRTELKAEIAAVRSELKGEIADLRTELKTEIAGVRSELKEEIGKVREDVSAIKAMLPQFATKSDLGAMETRIIKWFIFTGVGIGTLAFSIAKFVG